MKDYNSIPFKNKAIDRLTRNTTIVPDTQYEGTQLKEVKVTPASISYDQSNNIQGYNKAPMRPIKLDQRDQSNDKLVDSRPYKETPAYKEAKGVKPGKKPKKKMDLNDSDKAKLGVMGFLMGSALISTLNKRNGQ